MAVHEEDLHRIRKKKKKREKMMDLEKELNEGLDVFNEYLFRKTQLNVYELRLDSILRNYLKDFKFKNISCYFVDNGFRGDNHLKIRVFFQNRAELEKAKENVSLFKKNVFDNGENVLGCNVYLTRQDIHELFSDLKKEEK